MGANLSERIEYRRVPEMPGVEALLVERCARSWRVYHETYSICSLVDLSGGETHWTYRGKLHSSRAGGLMLMEPGEVHANPPRSVPLADFQAVFIAPTLVERAALEMGMAMPRPHLKFAHVADPACFATFARFHATLEDGCSSLERESSFANCLRLLCEQCSETGTPVFQQATRSTLLRARELIRTEYSRPIRLDEVAAAIGVSRYHAVRAFANKFGMPPHAYQIRVQVEKARNLLAAGVAPARVAAAVGFADQSHFTRHFKKIVGVTPGTYARSS